MGKPADARHQLYDDVSGGIIPFYLVVTQNLNMYDSRWALIIPSCMSAFT